MDFCCFVVISLKKWIMAFKFFESFFNSLSAPRINYQISYVFFLITHHFWLDSLCWLIRPGKFYQGLTWRYVLSVIGSLLSWAFFRKKRRNLKFVHFNLFRILKWSISSFLVTDCLKEISCSILKKDQFLNFFNFFKRKTTL